MPQVLTVRLEGALVSVAAAGEPPAVETPAPSRQDLLAQDLRRQTESAQAQREQLAQATAALESALRQLEQLRLQLVADTESQLVELSLDIARKVLMQAIAAGQYEIDPIVKEALLHVPARQDVVIRLNPQDWARCTMAQKSDEAGNLGGVRFVADGGVQPAECVLETAEGVIESRVDRHLEEIGQALRSMQ